MSTAESPSGHDASSSAFHEALGDYLARIERDGSGALDDFRRKHPEFAERLGRQLEWLADHLARRREGVPERIGPYRVLQRLGRGGMGEVFLGEQTTPFRRAIAIKVIRAATTNEARSARFAQEIQALASLSHDGIARLFEAGEADGRPYFTMEYVPGKPITDYCAEERLDLPARLRLFVDVCRAVEYAHRQGILHRDLKPSNILVFGPRHEPTAKIIDFGLAKLIEPAGAAVGPRSETGQIVGTPDYMSPEQVDDTRQRAVDTRSDVYSLGVVLYELMTGVLPLSLWQARGQDLDAMLRAIRERQPSSPSVRVEEGTAEVETSPAVVCALSPHRLSRMLAGDLDAIAMKALAKDADHRYGGAAWLADDIVRHLEHRPVSARAPTWRYLAGRFVRRHRAAVAFVATLLVVAFASLVVINLLAAASIRNLERAELFGLVRFLEELRLRDAVPPPARPEHLGELEEWLADFDRVLAQRGRMRAAVRAPQVAPEDRAAAGAWAAGATAQRMLTEVLRVALSDLDAMTAPGAERDRMVLRIDWARRVVAATVDARRADWERARRDVLQDPRYGGLDLRPQPGLVPLGPDPTSGLQEFALPLPGCDVPRRTERGFTIGPATAPIFVLLPGGAIAVGSQADDPAAARYDPGRRPFEPDVTTVDIEPFLAAKYELTNGAWRAIDPGGGGAAPADSPPEPTHPVVGASGESMLHVLHAWGMRLPTAAEWECLARGGADTPWSSGAALASLERCANLHDRAVDEGGIRGEGEAVPWSDGHPVTAPVGSFAPNGFGLFDVHGNAAEVVVRTVGDGGDELDLRGGSWHQGAGAARLTARTFWDGRPLPSIGCRPVISLQR